MNWLRAQWKERGTQLLGLLVAFASCAVVLSDDILNVTPLPYRPFVHLALGAIGFFVARRGRTNQQNLSDQ